MSDAEPATARRRWRPDLGAVVLALVAYLPALASSPGEVPADTKLSLYLDPGRLLADSLWSWDDRQFAGWVPHQTIGYLWPSGPWFWTMERLGVPDWVAHRLWIATILLAAGLGARWCARRLGLGVGPALLAGFVYQLSPFVLPYISRTSVLLLPFAGLGWLIGITVSATRRGGWRDIAAFALVVATVGGINATAMVMIAPAPLLWILDATLRREITVRRALTTTLRLGGASVAVSLWWLVALSVQAVFGAPVLNYTETLESVSFTSVSTEALRGLGYWLFYVRDQAGPLTSMSLHYQVSTVVIGAGFVLIVAGLLGLATVRWRPRRFLSWLLLVGVVLAVGAHPIDDPSPLGRPLADSATSTITLALRSSTRAVPLTVLALALGIGALVASLQLRRPRLAPVVAAVVVVVAIVNLPALRQRQLVDPVLAHPETMPSAWTDLAARLDGRSTDYRTLQLPGTESAVARWGQTVDPVLPGLTTRSVVQRDWLPLGSAPAMDLFYALDDRFQTGTLDPDAIAPVARVFGADSVVFAGDVAFDRFRTARPELTWSIYEGRPAGLGSPIAVGAEIVNVPTIPMLDDRALGDDRVGQAVPQTALIDVEQPEPIVTARSGSTVLVGDGAGFVSAAGAGLLDGTELVRSSAALDDAALADALSEADEVIVTDSNRRQAHQWRGSQDALGHVERADEEPLRFDPFDHRLPVFPEQTVDDQTVVEVDGPITASATSYGEVAALRPEDRAAMAIDGDPATAWLVADRGDPIGERIRLTLDDTREVGVVRVLQTGDPTARRRITELEIRTEAGAELVPLDDSSTVGDGQTIEIDASTAWIELTVTGTDVPGLANHAGYGPVGLAEIVVDDLPPSSELLRLPTRGIDVPESTPLSIVVDRWRIDATDRWRRDPEPSLARRFELADDRAFTPDVTARVALDAPDAVVAELLGLPPTVSVSSHLSGTPTSGGWAALDGDPATAWTTAFGDAEGASITVAVEPGTEIATLAGSAVVDDRHSVPTELILSAGAQERRVPVDPRTGAFATSFEALTADSVTVRVGSLEPRTTIDRRFGEPILLPIAISELTLAGAPVVAWPTIVSIPCVELFELDGTVVSFSLTGEFERLVRGEPFAVTSCGSSDIELGDGVHDLTSPTGTRTGIDTDAVTLISGVAEGGGAEIPIDIVSSGRGERVVEIGPCPDGCWLVTGDGWNTGWNASIDGEGLGAPEAVDGGFNGWYLPPGTPRVTVDVHWTPQRRIWAGLAVSVIAGLVAAVVLVRTRRQVPAGAIASPEWLSPVERITHRRWRVAAMCGVVAAVAIAPLWGLGAFVLAALGVTVRRPALLAGAGTMLIAGIGAFYVAHQRDGRFLPGFGWVVNIESTHRLTLLALVLVVGGLLADPSDAEHAGERR